MALSYCGRCMTTFDGSPMGCPNLSCGGRRPAEGWGIVLSPGDLLDRRYRVERCLAVGGAGLTYLAKEIADDEQPVGPSVAVKVLYNARASGPFLKRLSTEFQILQELAHPHIVELRGFVHRSGHEPYLVTRFEEGGSLAQHVDRAGPLPPKVAAGILRQVLLALDTAHQRGVVHRDLKPDNVLLAVRTERDVVPHVRVADFGIAKIAGGMMNSQLTRAGAFVGTPEYAAPEQFLGQNPTPATDVFAAGALLWFLLQARPPFVFPERSDVDACLAEQLARLPLHLPPMPETPPDEQVVLQSALEGMMAERPEDRFTVHRALQVLQPLVGVAPRAGTLEITSRPAPGRDRAPDTYPPVTPTPQALEVSASDAPAKPPPPPTSAPRAALPPSAPLPRPPRPGATAPPPPVRATNPAPPPPPVEEAPPPPPVQEAAPPPPPPVDLAPPPPPPPPVDAPPPLPPSAIPVVEPPPPPPADPLSLSRPAEETYVAAPTDEQPRPTAPTLEPAPEPSEPETVDPVADPPPVPVVASEPAPPPVEPAPRPPAKTPAPPPAGRSRAAAAGVAGCFGLSVLSASALIALVLVVLGVAAVGAAWYVREAPTPVVVDDPVPERFRDARPLPPFQVQRVQRQVAQAAPEIGARCGRNATVTADLLVDTAGRIVYAHVEPTTGVDVTCVERGLLRLHLRNGPPVEGIARVTFQL